MGDNIPKEPDLFHFLQCATVASPGDKKWGLRIKEEKYALVKLIEYIEYWEKIGDNPRWFSIKPVNEDATKWAGTVTCQNYQFDIELVLKKTYPHTPPAARVPVLIDYTDRKLEDEVLGLRICDMHMEQNFWWNEHCSIALYLKREVSYWVQSVLTLAIRQGYL